MIEIIDWILKITGLFSIILAIISIIINRKSFETNIQIDRIINEENLTLNDDNIIKYKDPDSINSGEYILFQPIGSNFKKVYFYSLHFNGKKLRKKKLIKKFDNINSTNGLLIESYYPCGIPTRMIEWKADYGVRGKYILAENGKNGNVRKDHYFYRYNLLANIRRKLNWK